MEYSLRHILTVAHGWGFGAVFLVGFPAALLALTGMTSRDEPGPSERDQRLLAAGLWVMAATGWVAVLTGAYVIYPWYRAKPPAGVTDLAAFPRSLLLSHPDTVWWHSFGMEWKEHVSWIAPILLTVVAYLFSVYGASLSRHRPARNAMLALTLVGFLTAGIAGEFGKLLGQVAPVGNSSAAAPAGKSEK
jgi:hypothetical protein